VTEWDSTPAYKRVLNDLRGKIERGEIGPDEPIPSVATLIVQYGVAGTTVQKAVRALKAAGLVDSVPGKGVFVRAVKRRVSRSVDFVTPVPDGAPLPYGRSTPPQVTKTVPPDDVAEKLELEPGEHAVRRYRVMFDADDPGVPIQIATSWIPLQIAQGTELERPGRLRGGLPAALKRAGYPPRTPAREWLTARMPTSDEARALLIDAGIPVLRVLRQTLTDFHRPVEALEIVLSGDLFEMEYDLQITEE
jgi:GntR family transcriptional regulator